MFQVITGVLVRGAEVKIRDQDYGYGPTNLVEVDGVGTWVKSAQRSRDFEEVADGVVFSLGIWGKLKWKDKDKQPVAPPQGEQWSDPNAAKPAPAPVAPQKPVAPAPAPKKRVTQSPPEGASPGLRQEVTEERATPNLQLIIAFLRHLAHDIDDWFGEGASQ